MNNTGLVEPTDNQLIQKVYADYIYAHAVISSLALIFYPTLLNLPQEIENIWLNWKHFSLPALLYIFARYGVLINQGLNTCSVMTPCNTVAEIANVMSIVGYIGYQGLLVARAYSLCRGGRIFSTILVLGFLSGLIVFSSDTMVFSGCVPQCTDTIIFPVFLIPVVTIINCFTNSVIFSVCVWKMWRMWKLKRETGFQSSSSLITIFLVQTISLSFFFITIPTILTNVSLLQTTASNQSNAEIATVLQNALQAIVVADFTLDLRCRNSNKIQASTISVPSLQIRSVLQHVRQSFLVELATPDPEDTDADVGSTGDHNDEISPDRLQE